MDLWRALFYPEAETTSPRTHFYERESLKVKSPYGPFLPFSQNRIPMDQPTEARV